MSRVCTVAVIAFVLFGAFTARSQSADLPPNIVFIIADDLGYGDSGLLRAKEDPHAEPGPACH